MKLKFISLFVIVFLTFSSGFAQKKKDKKKKEKSSAPKLEVVQLKETPKFPTIELAPTAPPQNGSLFTTGGQNVSLLTDFKANKIGDLVFVNIVETSLATVNSSADRNKDSGGSGGLTTLVDALPFPGSGIVSSVIGGLGNRTYEGSGATERASNVRARITARVIDVLPNGDLLIQAIKQVKINKETEQLAVTGIVRKNDLATDNSIPTTYIGDLRVEFNGKGVASKENAPGWLARLFDKINPF